MESKKINQLATELAPDLSDLTIIGDPTTGISKKITLSQMASLFTGTVEEYANLAAFPITGVADTIYIAKDTNVIYRWDSTAYVVLSPNIIASLVFNDANGFDGTIALVGSVATLTITTALTSGSVPFIGASGALTQDNANLFFDDTNNRLGINTNAPTTALDVFGSGIIGRINGTSTNNAYLGFASAGTNKWSVGNVQSDHRFRIFSEANSAELITILQTGEFGIGIANPTTKFHIDGAASALIANLDANVSIAKSLSYRSDNSARINLEVSGTESGSNVGADFFLRTFTDAGSLLETPFTIVRSTGVTTIKSLTLTNVLSIANGGTGSSTQNFVDLTSVQTAAGAKTFSSITTISNATASTSTTTGGLVVTGGVGIGGALFGTSATFTSATIPAMNGPITLTGNSTSTSRFIITGTDANGAALFLNSGSTNGRNWGIYSNGIGAVGELAFYNVTNNINALNILPTGSATFLTSDAVNAAFNSTNASGGYISFKRSGTNIGYLGNSGQLGIGTLNALELRADNNLFLTTTSGTLSILSTGNVGIGTSSPAEKLHVEGIIRATSSTTGINLHPNADFGAGSLPTIQVYTNHALQFATNNSLRMNITSGGILLVGGITTTSAYLDGYISVSVPSGTAPAACFKNLNSGQFVASFWSNDSSGNNIFQTFVTDSGSIIRGTIDYNRTGGVTRYNTTSDGNLKNIIGYSNKQKSSDILNSTKIREYSWKDDETNKSQIGVIAQELYETFKGAVTKGSDAELLGTEDYKQWGVDKTAFTFHLIAGWQKHEQMIQEQQALITSLQSQINELKNK